LGPSGIETELRNLSPDDGGSVEVMRSFLSMIGMMLDRKRDFELAQAYLALFLKVSEIRYFPLYVAVLSNKSAKMGMFCIYSIE
jgi:hypothetical protein